MRILGDRALLFTDIEGSTALLQKIGPRYADVLDQHHHLMRDAIRRGGGEEIQSEGDAFVVIFTTTAGALATAIDAQLHLAEGPWPNDSSVSVRMGVHWGEIGRSTSGYVGMPLHEAARVANAAHGGQILVSDAARNALVANPAVDVSLRHLGQFPLKDIGTNVPLFQVDHPRLRTQFPPPRTGGGHHNNLPGQLTTFIGRETEAAQVDALLREHRLVTLSGAGGIGKTRLALNVAANASPRFADGVWFVELAHLQRVEEIVDEIRTCMRVPDDDMTEASLLRALRPKVALLVLDNCEHVVDETAALVNRLLKACPDVRVLATSREPFGFAGEARWRVPSLGSAEAVALFAACAETAAPGLAFRADELEVVGRICQRLEGIPLAIELAAARAETMTVGQIEQRLLDRFQLLNVASRGGGSRHQTLRATLDWSHRLLTDEEKVLFRRIAVFRGQPECDAVMAISGDSEVDVDQLQGLHSKSLLRIDTSVRPPRVQLSEIVRQFAAELLEESGEAAAMPERHARHYSAWTEEARDGFLELERFDWLRRFADSEDECVAAFDWLDANAPSEAAILLGNLREWLVSGDNRAWRVRLRRTAERTDINPRARAVVNALLALLAGGYGRESADVAAGAARRATAALDAVVDPDERLTVLANLALGARDSDPTLAAELADRAVAEAEMRGSDPRAAWPLADLLLVRHEHHPETRRLRRLLLGLIDSLGSRWSNVNPFVDQALDDHQVGRHDDAVRWLDVAENTVARLPHRRDVVSEDDLNLALWSVFIRAETGEVALAMMTAEDVLGRLDDTDLDRRKILSSTYGHALLLAGRPAPARAAFELATDRPDGWRYLTFAIASVGLAILDVEEGSAEAAYARLEPIATANRRLWMRARAHDAMAEAALALGDPALAATHVAQSAALREQDRFVVPPALRERQASLMRRIAVAAG